MIDILNLASVTFGLLAASLWWRSTAVRVKPNPNNTDFAIIDDGNGKGETDVLATIERQVVWNSRAAKVTCLAVLCQALSLLAQMIPRMTE